MLFRSALTPTAVLEAPVVLAMIAPSPMAVFRSPVVLLESALTHCRVEGAGGVALECIRAVGRVVAAGRVAKERIRTVGRVVVAGCVDRSALKPVAVLSLPVLLKSGRSKPYRSPCCRSPVVLSKERIKTDGRVFEPVVRLKSASDPQPCWRRDSLRLGWGNRLRCRAKARRMRLAVE